MAVIGWCIDPTEMQTPKNKDVFYVFDMDNEGITHIYFNVEDIDEEYERIREMGGATLF